MHSGSEYYRAYDQRYRQVHEKGLSWFGDQPSPIIAQMIEKYGLNKDARMLEIGCGEGRDARVLLQQGYGLLATDISEAAIAYCKKADPDHAQHYQVLDAIHGEMPEKFDFIFAMAVLHMLVLDEDRAAFLRFVCKQLNEGGMALIVAMGDGEEAWQSDISKAFDNQLRIHEQTGVQLQLAATSCRVVSLAHLQSEISDARLKLLESGHTSVENDFPVSLYVLAQR